MTTKAEYERVNNFITLQTMLKELPTHEATQVRELQAQAIGYVWGWQDAGGDPKETDVSVEFGYAYGIHAAEYYANVRGLRRNIADAFKAWRAGRLIADTQPVARAS